VTGRYSNQLNYRTSSESACYDWQTVFAESSRSSSSSHEISLCLFRGTPIKESSDFS